MNTLYAWVGDLEDEQWLLLHDLDELPENEFALFKDVTYFGVVQSSTFDEAVRELVQLAGVSPERTAASKSVGVHNGRILGMSTV
jgi:hypothetical protein